MSAINKKQKDQEMAQRLKTLGIERRSGRCCICYRMVHLDSLYIHITARCTGPVRKGTRHKGYEGGTVKPGYSDAY